MDTMQAIKIETLAGGAYLKLINDAINRANQDVINRVGVEKDRKVTIVLKITPNVDYSNGMNDPINTPVITIEVKTGLPGETAQALRGLVMTNPKTGEVELLVESGNPPLFEELAKIEEKEGLIASAEVISIEQAQN